MCKVAVVQIVHGYRGRNWNYGAVSMISLDTKPNYFYKQLTNTKYKINTHVLLTGQAKSQVLR